MYESLKVVYLCSKVAGYDANIQKSTAFLHTRNEPLKCKILSITIYNNTKKTILRYNKICTGNTRGKTIKLDKRPKIEIEK